MTALPRACAPALVFTLATLVVAVAPHLPAHAQAAPWPANASPAELIAQAMSDLRAPLIGGDTADFVALDLSDKRVVKGAPYCADAVHETVQTLADGNRIVRSSRSRLCRDGEGRTRQESERSGRKLVWLTDPVAREAWVLDPERKTARPVAMALDLRRGAATSGGDFAERMREYAERMREYAQRLRDPARADSGSPPMPPVPPMVGASGAQPVAVVRQVIRERDASGRETEQVEMRVVQVDPINATTRQSVVRLPASAASAGTVVLTLPGSPGAGQNSSLPPLPPMPPVPASVSVASLALAPRGPGVDTPLGTREIEGVKANGERTTWTIEAGKVGNEKPIVITREVWTAPELMLTVLSRDVDPRTVETNYRLGNLKRGEPDPALMRVPADYQVQRPSDGPRQPLPPAPPATPPAPTGKG